MKLAPAQGAKQKILAAAEELARELGPGNLSLDAVAARAGVSKGGLLYHFHSKTSLLRALVEVFLQSFDTALSERELQYRGAPNSLAEAYLDLFIEDHRSHQPPPSGLLAALAEDPGFLAPVREYERGCLDRMKQGAADPEAATVVMLAINGIRSAQLLNIEVLTEDEFDKVTDRLRQLLRDGAER